MKSATPMREESIMKSINAKTSAKVRKCLIEIKKAQLL